MPYQQNKPQANDQLDDSQVDIQGNFQAIKTLVDVNHVTFDLANQGKHNECTFPQNALPTPVVGTDINIYNALSPFTGANQMFIAKGGTIFDWTSLLTVGAPVTQGWTRLASGLLIKFGRATTTGLNQPVLFPVNVNTPIYGANPFISSLTLFAADDRRITLTAISTTGFSVSIRDDTGAGNTAEFFYLFAGV